MSKGGFWGGGVLRSTVLEVWRRTVGVFQRFAVGVAGQSGPIIRQENSSTFARPTDDFKTVEVELRGGIAEFEQFTKAMRIGDRVRAFCTDGVIEAQKVSQTRFKVIYEVPTTGPIH